jgi:thiol-disulfide isomerase/thioredoxin
MKNDILPKVAKGGGLDGVEFAYVDTDRQPKIAARLSQADVIPQLIRLDRTKDGWKNQVLVGAKSPAEIRSFVKTDNGPAGQPGAAAVAKQPKSDYKSAHARSIASGKPLLVLIGADWCPACVQMKDNILPRVAKAGGLKLVEFAYIDYDKQPEVATQLARGGAIPQLIRLMKTDEGWNSRVLVGAKSPTEVSSFINAGLAAPERTENTAEGPKGRTVSAKQSDWTDVFRPRNPLATSEHESATVSRKK